MDTQQIISLAAMAIALLSFVLSSRKETRRHCKTSAVSSSH